MSHFSLRTTMPVERLSLFQWHLNRGAFQRMAPPWIHFTYPKKMPSPSDLKVPFDIRIKKGIFRTKLKVAHTQFVWGQMFAEEQIKGPFSSFRHEHRFLAGNDKESYLEDEVVFDIGYGFKAWVGEKIQRILEYRHELLLSDFVFLKKYPDRKLKILISGTTGLIGSMLKAFLTSHGHEVWSLVRKKDLEERQIFWDPGNGQLLTKDLEGFDAIIHLAGASIGSLLWTEETKKKIALSRVHSTWLLAKAISRLQHPPETFIFASGIGYYGSYFHNVDETSPKGEGFMSDLAFDIEYSTESAKKVCRVVPLRMAAVLSMEGGYLAKMLPIAAAFGRLSTGNPQRSLAWVDREDVIRAIYHILFNKDLNGPINIVAPEETTEEQFWKELAHAMNRPFLCPLPVFFLKKINPILCKELLAADQGKIESKLFGSDFQFSKKTLKDSLKYTSEYLL